MRTDQSPASKELYLDRELRLIFGVTMMVVMGVSSIAPAFPKMIAQLGITPRHTGMLITVFTLPGVFLAPVLGILADRWGRKKVLVPSLVCFGLFGGACGFVQDFQTLLVLRFFQGVGAASLGALNITIISDLYSGRDRLTAMGYNASVLSLGTTVYPALGGGLAMLGWNYPFFLPVLALPLALAVLFFLDAPEPESVQKLAAYMKSALKYAAAPRAVGLFVTTVITFIVLYGVFIAYFPIYLARSFGAAPWAIGTVMAVSCLGTAVTASQLGRLGSRVRQSTLLLAAFFLYALALFFVPMMPGLWLVMLPAVVFGVAQGLNIPSVQMLLAELAPMEQRGAFMAINGMMLRIGQTLGPVLMTVVFGMFGMQAVFWAGAVLAVFMAGLALWLVR